jgi:predicted amidophosphoribosyltransferase
MSRIASAEPYSDRTANPHRTDYWTCPGCYEDLGDIGSGRHRCPTCDRAIVCTVEYEPECVTRLDDPEEKE